MRLEVATLAGGCFWCLEAVFNDLQGVESVVSGYSGGHVPHPTYEQVCDDTTGHAEVVQIPFDPAVISYGDSIPLGDLLPLARPEGDGGGGHAGTDRSRRLAAAYRAAGREMGTEPALRFVTASLRVDYLRPTPLGVPLEIRGRVKEIQRRKVIVTATVSAEGEVTARGEIVAVQMPEHLKPKTAPVGLRVAFLTVGPSPAPSWA